MSTHHRQTRLLRLLARLGWQRDPELWTIPCRDGHGHRCQLQVRLITKGVTLTASAPGPWALEPLRVGQLRAALRDALLTVDSLAGSGTYMPGTNHRNRRSTAIGIPESRRTIRLDHHTPLSVYEISSRTARPTPPAWEGNDDNTASAVRAVGADKGPA